MVLCEIVGSVSAAPFPIDMELALPDSIFNPIKSHVHGFGSFLFDGFVGDAVRDLVVGDHWSGWLRMSKFGEGDAFAIKHGGVRGEV